MSSKFTFTAKEVFLKIKELNHTNPNPEDVAKAISMSLEEAKNDGDPQKINFWTEVKMVYENFGIPGNPVPEDDQSFS